MANILPPTALANPAITGKQIEIIEDVMNGTIREAVMVTELLDSGDTEAAMDALIQIQMNAGNTIRRLETLIKRGEKQLKKEAARG